MTKYTVKATDTEYSVANDFKISVGYLRKANENQPQPYLVEGREIDVPVDGAATSNADNTVKGSASADKHNSSSLSGSVTSKSNNSNSSSNDSSTTK
jgi:LysM repeat protein